MLLLTRDIRVVVQNIWGVYLACRAIFTNFADYFKIAL